MENKVDILLTIFSTLLISSFIICCILLIRIGSLGIQSQPEISTVEAVEILQTDNEISDPVIDEGQEPNLEYDKYENDDLIGEATLKTIKTTSIPENNLIELSKKYKKVLNISPQLVGPPVQYAIGASRNFWVLNVSDNEYRSIKAELIYETPHVYFWIEQGVDYLYSDVKDLVDTFENKIYPLNKHIFGDEWSPGIDNDTHLTILYAKNLGGASGYFSSADLVTPQINKYSNFSEMFYLSADYVDIGDEFAYGVLAHEFQHMIHWNIDRNETTWVSEGLSELAVELNGFRNGGFIQSFIFQPDLQLNFWPGNDQGASSPHYGASHLFMRYLNQRFGTGVISNLVMEQTDGFEGLDEVLDIPDDYENKKVGTSETIFQDWTIANFVQDIEIEDGVYGYSENEMIQSSLWPVETFECGGEPIQREVKQFGSDYLEIICGSDYEILLDINDEIPVILENPHSGEFYFWSFRGAESAMRLSREFDFTQIEGPIEMSYWTWFDIEKDYDYLYVNISEDGENWENIQTQSCTMENPTGSNFGCGYNGKSNGWEEEIIDLSYYAGKSITIEFEYITDASVNGEGFLLDDISIDAIDYFNDFEEGSDSWIAEGFLRIENVLPQTFGFSIINKDDGTEVEKHILNSEDIPTFKIDNSDPDENEVLVISGLTRFTHLPAEYKISIEEMN